MLKKQNARPGAHEVSAAAVKPQQAVAAEAAHDAGLRHQIAQALSAPEAPTIIELAGAHQLMVGQEGKELLLATRSAFEPPKHFRQLRVLLSKLARQSVPEKPDLFIQA